jgi:hypothetical protein
MKKLGILVVLSLAVVLGASPVLAGCSPATTAGNVHPQFAQYSPINFGGDATNDLNRFSGGFWKTSSTAANSGTYTAEQWMVYLSPYGVFYFVISTGAAGVTEPCVDTCMTVMIEDELTDTYVLWTTDDTLANTFNFDFTCAAGGACKAAVNASPGPRPRVSGTSRDGTNITVNFDVLDPTPGVWSDITECGGGAITDVRVYSFSSATAPSPLLADGWVEIADLTSTGGGGSAILDCSNIANDQWIATGLWVNSLEPVYVSNPTQIECDPDLADPGFDIDKPGQRKGRDKGLKKGWDKK